MAAERWRGRRPRVGRLALWVAVVMLLAGGALAYSCAPAAGPAAGRHLILTDGGVKTRTAPVYDFRAGSIPPGLTVIAIAGE